MSVKPQVESDSLTYQTKKHIDVLLTQASRLQDDADRLFLLASEARELSRAAQYAHGQAQSDLLLAGYYERKENYPDALEACFNALAAARDSGDAATRARALYTLAGLYLHIDDAAEALACADQGLELLIANDALLWLGLAELFFQLQVLRGDLLMRLNRHGEALAGYLEALPAAQETGGAALERLQLSISECHLMTGNLTAAMEINRKAMAVALSHNLGPAELTIVETQRGVICERSADLACALRSYKDALNHAIRSSSKYAVSSTLASIGRLQLALRQVDAAKATLNKALAIAWEIDSDELAREIHERLALWYDERDYLDCDAPPAPAPALVNEDEALRRRLSHINGLQAAPEHRDNQEIFRRINKEIKERMEEIRSLRQDLEEQARSMSAVADISRALSSATDMSQDIQLLSAELQKVLAFDALAVGVCKDGQKHVEYRAVCIGSVAVPAERRSHPAEILKAIRNGRDAMLTDIRPEDAQRYAIAAMDAEALPRSVLFCPFLCYGEPHVLALHSRQADAFDSMDLRLLRAVAQVLGLAMGSQVRMASLTRQEAALQQVMRTDALTGLLSRHNIIERIGEESIRTQRSGRPFSLVLMEADQLKGLRDICGQECIDALLKQLSRLLKPSIRKQDFLARWSDDQIAILLPETDADGAALLCEKLRRKCAKQAFPWQGQEYALSLTCGLTEHRAARSLDAMQKAAESALLAAKLKGRDCVEKR